MSEASTALSNLRAIVILIVVAFHSSLAYLASAPSRAMPFDEAPFRWQVFPIIDTHRWLGLDIFCAWQDVSLMTLMFLLAGIFSANSLLRKGTLRYLLGRAWRIGIPFVFAILVLSPLAIYPAYSIRVFNPNFVDFWRHWFALPFWPSGPAWFLWQLLAMNAVAAVVYSFFPGLFVFLRSFAGRALATPVNCFLILVALSAATYAPLAFFYSPWEWGAVGPFSLQLSRPGHYSLYFFVGLALGSYGLDRGLLKCDGALARNWAVWLSAAAIGFCVWAYITSFTMNDWSRIHVLLRLGAAFAFVLACAAACLCLIGFFLYFSRRRRAIFDTLSANAYGIYLVHYPFIVWLQFALLDRNASAPVKAINVFLVSLALSWTCSILANRVLTAIAANRRFAATFRERKNSYAAQFYTSNAKPVP